MFSETEKQFQKQYKITKQIMNGKAEDTSGEQFFGSIISASQQWQGTRNDRYREILGLLQEHNTMRSPTQTWTTQKFYNELQRKKLPWACSVALPVTKCKESIKWNYKKCFWNVYYILQFQHSEYYTP